MVIIQWEREHQHLEEKTKKAIILDAEDVDDIVTTKRQKFALHADSVEPQD
jgi:hypothetical protein